MKRCLILISCSLFFLISTVNANAVDAANCSIELIGAYGGFENQATNRSNYPIFLKCPSAFAGGERMYFLSYEMGKGGLATALTAFNMDKEVWVRLSTLSPGGIVSVMYVEK
jgi:hypothetical protein